MSKAVFTPEGQPIDIGVQGIDFIKAASLNLIEGVSFVRKFSSNPSILQAVGFRDVWEFGSSTKGNINYTFTADGTATIDSMSSSNALDLQLVRVEGLDIDGIFVVQDVVLNGQNKVALTTPLWRLLRAHNLATSTTADRAIGFNGDVYFYEDSAITAGVPDDDNKVKGYISPGGNNQTLQSMYAIPKGFLGLFLGHQSKILSKPASAVSTKIHIREFGKLFRVLDLGLINSTGTSALFDENLVPGLVPEKSDILFSGDTDVNGSAVSVNYSLLLFDTSRWGDAGEGIFQF